MHMRFGVFSNVPLFSVRFEYMTFTRPVSLKGKFCIGPFTCFKVMSTPIPPWYTVPLIVVNRPITRMARLDALV